MEENLDINNEVNKEIPEKPKSNSEEIKQPRSEKDPNTVINNGNTQSNFVSEVSKRNQYK